MTDAGIPGIWVQATGAGTRGVAITNANGAYDLLLPAGQYAVTALAGPYLPGVSQKGYVGFANLPVNTTVAGTTVLPDIVLPPGNISVTGRILDPTGTPVPGIPVAASIRGTTDNRQPICYGISDATGSYTLGLFAGSDWDIALDSTLDHLGTDQNDLTITTATSNNDLVAHPITAWVLGVVRDTDNNPLPGIEVRLRTTDSTITSSVLTAADGTYRIGAFAGEWYVTTSGAPLVPEQGITLLDGQSATADFTVDVTPPLVAITSPQSGTVATGQPLLAYSVTEGDVVVKVDGMVVGKVSGETLDSLAAGEHTVRVEATDLSGNLGFAEVTFTVL